MTVLSTTTQVSYTGNGVATTYLGTFEAIAPADIVVTVGGAAVVYAVAGDVTAPNTWNVVFSTPPASGAVIVISRNTPETQATDYQAYGRYQAEQIEADFDKLTMITQELRYNVDNPPPIIFPIQTAAEVPFSPVGGVSSTDVQAAIAEIDSDYRLADQNYALTSTKVQSGDPQTLAVANPTLANDVLISTITNIANGLVKLDNTGKIPVELLSTTGLSYVGTWDPNTQGATPPASGFLSSDFFIFEEDGTMSLREASDPQSHNVSVFVNDYMVYTTGTAGFDGWYYVHNAQQQIITASGVSFVPVGSLISGDVQQAIAELDATLSQRFYDAGNDAVVARYNGSFLEPVLATTSGGPILYYGGQPKLTLNQYAHLYGLYPHTNLLQEALLQFLSSDGVQQGYVGFQAGVMILRSTRVGAPLILYAQGAGPNASAILQGQPDGPTYLYSQGKPRFAIGSQDVIIYSPHLSSAANIVGLYLIQDVNGETMAYMGLPGTRDVYLYNNLPGGMLRLRVNSGREITLEDANGAVALPGDTTVAGQASVSAPAPTLPSHLTRKDYVDQVLAGYTSPDTTIQASVSYAHNLGGAPSFFTCVLVCVIAQAGYLPGDMINLPGIMGSGNVGYQVGASATQVWFARSGVPAIIPRVGGAAVPITEGNWRFRISARL